MISKPIAKLAEVQKREGLSDKEMADRLGCSRQLWQMTRTGKAPLSSTITRGISENFPELHKELLKFLSDNGDKSSEVGAKNPVKPPSEPQGMWLKRFFVGLLGRIRK